MAKQSGLGDNFYVAGYDLSGDTNSLKKIGGGIAPLEVTGIDKSAFERIHGVRDGSIEFTTYFNPTSAQAFDVLSDLPTTDVHTMYCRGTALGSVSAALVGKQVDYSPTRGSDGSLTFDTSIQGNGYGLEWGKLLTAGKRTDTSATNGSSVDFAAGTSFGFQAYLQVFAFTGTSVTVKIQSSSDDGVGDAFADVTGGGFTAATGRTTQRIATATGLSIERYLRVVTTGTFSSAQFAVTVVKNKLTPVF
jgi:hypothetical protein